ncbi:MAG: VanZ family protein [Eubacteriales bacterium]
MDANKVKIWFSKIILTCYVLYLSYLTLFDKAYGRDTIHRSINIIPFKTIFQYLSGTLFTRAVIVNIFGNMTAFLPMGLLLPIVFKRCRNFVMCMTGVLISSIFIEVLQYITGVGASDIDDVILNAAGGIIGFFIFIFGRIILNKIGRVN